MGGSPNLPLANGVAINSFTDGDCNHEIPAQKKLGYDSMNLIGTGCNLHWLVRSTAVVFSAQIATLEEYL